MDGVLTTTDKGADEDTKADSQGMSAGYSFYKGGPDRVVFDRQVPKRFCAEVVEIVGDALDQLKDGEDPLGEWSEIPDHELYQFLLEEWEDLGEAMIFQDHEEAINRATDAANLAIILCVNAWRKYLDVQGE